MGFEFNYKIDGDYILFSNILNNFKKEIPQFKNCGPEGLVVVSKYLLDNIGFLNGEEFDEANEFLFIDNKGLVSVIIK